MGTTAKGTLDVQVVARALATPTASVLVMALVGLALVAGLQPPTVRTAAAPSGAATIDYGVDPPGRVAAVRPEFIADRLGPGFTGGLPAGLNRLHDTASTSTAQRSATSSGVLVKEFRCVGGRQTEDPLAPPCDDNTFTGDNGGATWRGVSQDEVRVLVRIEGAGPYAPPPPARSSSDAGANPGDAYVDLGSAPVGDEPIIVKPFRDLQAYFNRRYQTFGRSVRLILYFDDGHSHRQVTSRRLAVENDLVTRPFSALSLVRDYPFVDAYLDELAGRGVVAFEGSHFRAQAFFDRRSEHLWGYHATIEQQAALYSSYVCQKVAGLPVAISGDPTLRGRPRRIALLRTSNPSQLDYLLVGHLIREQLLQCGVTLADEATYRTNGEQCTNMPYEQEEEDMAKAREDLARFRARGVTTILWPGCPTSAHPLAASADGWLPEWVLLGDPFMSQAALAGTAAGAGAVWDRRAVMVSARPFQPPVWRTRCWAALQEVDPAEDDVAGRFSVCAWFGAMQQVFAGIQLAGPRLTPENLATGFRRLRLEGSLDPQVPTCSYGSQDSACIKDGQVLLFDLHGGGAEYDAARGVETGLPYMPAACWRAVQSGRRSMPGAWPAGNVDAQFRADDPCTYDQLQVPRDGIVVGRL